MENKAECAHISYHVVNQNTKQNMNKILGRNLPKKRPAPKLTREPKAPKCYEHTCWMCAVQWSLYDCATRMTGAIIGEKVVLLDQNQTWSTFA